MRGIQVTVVQEKDRAESEIVVAKTALPDLKARWEDWKQWRSRVELDQLL